MTTHRAISNGELAVDAPVLSITGLALRDNLKAVAEGDATVPNAEKIANAAFRNVAAGSVLSWSNLDGAEVTLNNTSSYPTYDKNVYNAENQMSVRVYAAGTITVKATHRGQTGDPSRVRVLKNGVQQIEWVGGTVDQTDSQDITVAYGDIITFQQRGDDASSVSIWKDLQIAADTIFWVNSVGGGL